MKFFLFCSSLIFLSGCATIFSQSSDTITFNSVPAGAKIEINGANYGRTPVTIPLKRSADPPSVWFKLDGYESRQITLQKSLNGVSLFNLLFFPGFAIDAASGAIMKYEVLHYEVDLDHIEQKQST